MLFNSLEFIIFFLLVISIYYSIPQRFKWIMLLCASYYFYMSWEPTYALLILLTTVIVYYTALAMNNKSQQKKKMLLILSITTNLGILFIFKYFNFFSSNIITFLDFLKINYTIPSMKLLLPVGISFYTFQALSYTIDVYRGDKEPEKHFGIFALYVSFFPQLVAGPIERSTSLLPQFKKEFNFDYNSVTDGMKLMAWGMFKKIVIADRLAILVDAVYANPDKYTGLVLLVATLFFAFQIYCDFSGYSDIAIGAAQMMGYKLMNNFDRPYFSKSIAEFWRRWHISLSTWFKDYLYIPLGGNRTTLQRWYANIMITFLVSGLWHGANWTFVIWGGLHGFYILFSSATASIRKKIIKVTHLDKFPKILGSFQIAITFSLTTIAWIFFRARNITDALYICKKILLLDLGTLHDFRLIQQSGALGYDSIMDLFFALLFIFILLIIQFLQESGNLLDRLKSKPIVLRWSLYVLLIVSIIFLGEYSLENPQFIYFQF